MLAGGRNSRMGQDQALLPWKGSTLIVVESAIQPKFLKMHDFVPTIQSSLWLAPDPSLFRNVNAPEQLTSEQGAQ